MTARQPGCTWYLLITAEVCKDKKERLELDESNLNPSSNSDSIGNIVFGNGNPHNTWQSTDDDTDKTLEIYLPDVNGVPPGDYQIMEVKVKPTGELGPVTVQILDQDNNEVFSVSQQSSCGDLMLTNYHI